MNKELFGVFGDRDEFVECRSGGGFNEVISGSGITAGIRDPGLGVPGRSASYADDRGLCFVWGEAYAGDDDGGGSGEDTNVAQWLFERYVADGFDAFSELNGSYLVVLAHDG
jgi:hypothetical protein